MKALRMGVSVLLVALLVRAPLAAMESSCRNTVQWKGATVSGEAVGCALQRVLRELARSGQLSYEGPEHVLGQRVSIRFDNETLQEALHRLLDGYSRYSVQEDGMAKLVIIGARGREKASATARPVTRRADGDRPRWRVRQGDRMIEVVAGPGTTVTAEDLAMFDLGEDVGPGPDEWDDFYPEQPAGARLTGPPAPDGHVTAELRSMVPDPLAILPEPEPTLAPSELRRREASIVNFEPFYSETGPARYENGREGGSVSTSADPGRRPGLLE